MNTNTNDSSNAVKSGKGRTFGSFSFGVVTLADLNAKFSDPLQPIPIYKKWATGVGFNIASKRVTEISMPSAPVAEAVQAQEPSIPLTIIDVDAVTPSPNSMAGSVTPPEKKTENPTAQTQSA